MMGCEYNKCPVELWRFQFKRFLRIEVGIFYLDVPGL